MHIVPLELAIPIGDIELAGSLALPEAPIGFVMFAHGSHSRFSASDRRVADLLRARGLATLQFDLLTEEEALRVDVDMLAARLVAATDSVVHLGRTLDLPIGYLGGGTGAAAALIAAARRPARIAAIVSRGGRPDLAGVSVKAVRAPTLFIVGGEDPGVLELNRAAAKRINAPHAIEIIPGATQLLEEPAALDSVGRLAADWFVRHFELRDASCPREVWLG
ncbi:MAG TPA: hypothetical protein VMJ10_24910 [Kofleriaceae bacterium]|nr:hypothetical protein [Kofleriaceae bacterium]